jgi:uroporphyrin-III C-methyltransferase / precorrin-2 dehydrogenase / sirohydrochlorin ferrochelatase
MRTFPLFLRLADRPVLLVGGGLAAAGKLRLLLSADARVTIVARDILPEIAELVAKDNLRHVARGFVAGDVIGQALVFSAGGDEALDIRVAEAARARAILVNVVDRPSLSDFLMPSIVDRGDIVIGISTGGAAPVLAQRLRWTIEAALPQGLDRLAAFAKRFRSAVNARIADHDRRRRFWARFFDGPIASAVLGGNERQAAREIIRAVNSDEPTNGGHFAELRIDGDNPDHLTLGDLRLLQQADLVLFEPGIASAIVDLARRDARRLDLTDETKALGQTMLKAGARIVHLVRKRQDKSLPVLAA